MYSTFNGVMTINQFIKFQDWATKKRQLDIKELENIIKITKFTKNYAKKIIKSGKDTNKVLLLISFESNKTDIKNIELIKIVYKK